MAMFNPPLDLSEARILVVNDDGIRAPGIKALERIAKTFTKDVWIFAPEEEPVITSPGSNTPLLTTDMTSDTVDCEDFSAWKGSPDPSKKPCANVPTISVTVITSGLATESNSTTVPSALEGVCLIRAPTVKL